MPAEGARKGSAEFSLETVELFVILNPFSSIPKQKFYKIPFEEKDIFFLTKSQSEMDGKR